MLRGMGAGLAMGSLWGGPSARAAGALTTRRLPNAARDYKILEIFFSGALSHRETFWVEQADEAPVLRGLDRIDLGQGSTLNPVGAPGDWTRWLGAQGAYRGADYRMGVTASKDVHLGPAGLPLITPMPGQNNRRLKDRLRVVASGHGIPAHEPAQTLMLTGATQNMPRRRISGPGATIARFSGLPSYVFYDSSLMDSTSSAGEAVRFGANGGMWAPFLIPYDQPNVQSLLSVARDGRRDTLSRHYHEQYELGLTFTHPSAGGERARSGALDGLLSSASTAFEGAALAQALGLLVGPQTKTLWENPSRRAIQTSVALLDANQSRYCCVVDGGVVGNSSIFSYYDQHPDLDLGEHSEFVTANLLNVLRTLWEEVDAGRLDLDDTLVVLNTEFGRSFSKVGEGSDHCNEGFAVAFLGGPIQSGGVIGDLRFVRSDDAMALELTNPATAAGPGGRAHLTGTDLRAAVLQSAGIHPFQSDIFEREESSSTSVTRDGAADEIATTLFA